MEPFTCRTCNVEKPLSEFRSYGRHNEKHYRQCKACAYEKFKIWKAEHPERTSKFSAEWTFRRRCKRRKVAPQNVRDAYSDQQGKCVICLDDIQLETCAIDHNHKTGEFRGLLCKKCNTSIAFLKDHPDTVDRAAKYLRERGHYGED